MDIDCVFFMSMTMMVCVDNCRQECLLVCSGKTLSTCKEELLSLAQKEETYGMVTYQVQDAARRPANLGLCPHGIRVMYGTIPTSIHQW